MKSGAPKQLFLNGFVKYGALKPLFLKGHVRGTLIFIRSIFGNSEKTNVILTKKGPSNPHGRPDATLILSEIKPPQATFDN